MPALLTIYKRNQGQTTRSLTAIGLALILGFLCHWLYGQLEIYVPVDKSHANMNVHNAKGWRLDRQWTGPKSPEHPEGQVYVAGAVVTDEMISEFDRKELKTFDFRPGRSISYAIYVHFGVPSLIFMVGAYFIFLAVNKERFADFLIATESEMKKVAWSSKAELIGSTAVVIITVILLAIVIYFSDLFVIKGLSVLNVY